MDCRLLSPLISRRCPAEALAKADHSGISLFETAGVMVIIVLILSAVIPANIQRVRNAKYQKTVEEMQTIAQASVDYDISQGACPDLISQLSPAYIPQSLLLSPFRTDYQLNCSGNMVSISNLIPAGLARGDPEGPLFEIIPEGDQDQIVITKTVPKIMTGRLMYDKKYF